MALKNFIILFVCFLSVLFINTKVFAADQQTLEFNFFYSKTCPHCIDEKAFLEKLENKYCDLKINRYVVSEGNNWRLLQNLYEQYNVPKEINGVKVYGAVPVSFVSDKYFLGYQNDDSTGQEIESYIKSLLGEVCATSTASTSNPVEIIHSQPTDTKTVSFLGWQLNLDEASPLFLAVVLGILDGFNACAMIILAFLLTTLIASGTRKRIVLIGGTFILVSGIVYYLFIAAWLNLFLISKNLDIITALVGVVVIIFAIFLLRAYSLGIVCRICGVDQGKVGALTRTQRRFFDKLKALTKSGASLPVLLLGVATIAAGVNLIELVCSFGFPVAFTQVLSETQLPAFSHYLYIFVYIFFYMLDDIIIFLLAVLTLRITGISEKYLSVVKLISALVLLLLGLIMLIKPELLAFG